MSGLVRRWTVRFVKAVVVAYVVGLAILFVLQRQLLFPAGKEPPSLERAGLAGLMEEAAITTADGLALLAWYHRPPKDAPLVVLFHGNGGTIEIRAAKAKTYISAGFGVLLLEYRGYGGNPGSPSEAGLYADGRAALAFAAAQGIAPDHVVLLGESLGTGVAVQMAVEQRVAALVLEAPYSSVADVARSVFPLFPSRGWCAIASTRRRRSRASASRCLSFTASAMEPSRSALAGHCSRPRRNRRKPCGCRMLDTTISRNLAPTLRCWISSSGTAWRRSVVRLNSRDAGR